MRRFAIAAILFWIWLPAAAAGFRAEPQAACAFLSETGLNAGTYRRVGEGIYRCTSRRRRLPFGDASRHALRYRAQGDADNVHQLRLTLYVNTQTQIQSARGRMLENGKHLVEKALGVNMPSGIAQSLMNGETGTWKVAHAGVVLQKTHVRTATHQYHLIIR